jgi:rhomboid family GlyGly-CTERM serine protease
MQLVANYGATLLLTLPALVILVMPNAESALQYSRDEVTGGQWHRLLSCHWTHWNGDHAFWDILMFGLLGAWCERQSRAGFLAATFASAAAISASLWCCAELSTYRGLSGLDSALFAFAAAAIFQEAWRTNQWLYLGGGALLAGAFIAKVSFEMLTGATLFVNSQEGEFLPIPFVHAVGAVIGAGIGWQCAPGRKIRSNLQAIPAELPERS